MGIRSREVKHTDWSAGVRGTIERWMGIKAVGYKRGRNKSYY
ncbi:MAG: hypothetical protein SV062_02375 [Thermodesulfobacteriota bacterium]|nr:hypothetical protein [Thermodesulfobacteriota bacterium]